MDMQSPAYQLRRLIDRGYVSEVSLTAITGVQPDALSAFLQSDASTMTLLPSSESVLSSDEEMRLSVLAAQLSEGLQVADDDRLKGVLESLIASCGLTVENVAHLVEVDVAVVQAVLSDVTSVPCEAKYALSGKVSYLINAFNQARAR